MDSGRKPRKPSRITTLFKRKKLRQQIPSPQTTPVQSHPPSDAKSGDRQRTRIRYFESVKLLGDAIKANQDKWGLFDFPELKGEPEDFNDSQFREKINTVMYAQRNDIIDQTAWEKCRHAVQCAFTAFSPFAKNFLTITKNIQAVSVILCLSHL